MPDSRPDRNSDNTPLTPRHPSFLTLMLATWSFVLWLGFLVTTFVVGTTQSISIGHESAVLGGVLALLSLLSHLPSPRPIKVEARSAVSDETNPLRR